MGIATLAALIMLGLLAFAVHRNSRSRSRDDEGAGEREHCPFCGKAKSRGDREDGAVNGSEDPGR
ncbi:hypothetical protein L21SP4_01089 [Kiritimatiella glycovorans]|uniref:Uncharacterized protein n=2 Tax=Kiritimatiella glycovorans TaxID=1307763 RepID=A0A0G3ED09_9BACT|nr:hypothetical protein L21SP4_01089 [Kiritimatiella glycovorans]